MSDTYVEADHTVGMPADHSSAADPPTAKDVQQQFVAALAKDDDVAAYAAERQSQEDAAKGKPVDRAARAERAQHARELLVKEQEQLRASDQIPDSQPEPDGSQPIDPAYARRHGEDDANYAHRIKQQGAFEASVRALPADKQQAVQTLAESLPYYDMRDDVKAAISRSPHGAEIYSQIATFDEGGMYWTNVVDWFNSQSPAEVQRSIHKLEALIEHGFGSQPTQQARRRTGAPAPISSPRGGAEPSQNISELAKSDDMTAFVRAREAQEKSARRR